MEDNLEIKSKPETVKTFLKSGKFWKPFLGIALGGLAGFLYYHFIGCTSGSCAITSNPYNAMLFGGFFGFFLTSSPCILGKSKK